MLSSAEHELRADQRMLVEAVTAMSPDDPSFVPPPLRLTEGSSVTVPGHTTDVVTRTLRIDNPVTCSLLTGRPRLSEGIVVEPAAGALVLTLDALGSRPGDGRWPARSR